MGKTIDEMWRDLLGLHRAVNATTTAYSQLYKTFNGSKPEIMLIVNEFGRGFPDHDFTYKVYGDDIQEQYQKAMDHLAEILKLKESA